MNDTPQSNIPNENTPESDVRPAPALVDTVRKEDTPSAQPQDKFKPIIPQPAGFIQAIQTCMMQKYGTFRGRATRSEFWFFMLFCWIIGALAGVVGPLVFPAPMDMPVSDGASNLSLLVTLIFVVPSWAVCARRLHDVNHSGWWQLIGLTGIGLLLLLYWGCKQGTPMNEPNAYTEYEPTSVQ